MVGCGTWPQVWPRLRAKACEGRERTDDHVAVLLGVPLLVLLLGALGDDVPRILRVQATQVRRSVIHAEAAPASQPAPAPSGVKAEFPDTHLRVCADLYPPLTKVALEAKGEDGCRVVVADFLLFGVVAHALTDVRVACAAAGRTATHRNRDTTDREATSVAQRHSTRRGEMRLRGQRRGGASGRAREKRVSGRPLTDERSGRTTRC